MTTLLKPVALGALAVTMMFAADVPEARFKLGFFREAAGLIIAPVRRTAMVYAVASTSANANAAAAAKASAAAAASAPPPASVAAGPPPVGTMVTALPPGCAQVRLNSVDYMRCGSTYYRASMMGTHLVFVVALP
ncbi:MAG: hypothetical protein EOP82_02950 [Variovorax sp.]|nr:MAG: hypothetical protein EOP82_02950 [Variovorax sp.]